MKKTFRISLAIFAVAASGMANALDFETLAGSSFVKSFVVTPSANNRLVLSVSGQATQYSALSFEILSGGPRVEAIVDNGSLAAAFSDRRNDDFWLTATPYTLQISGTTKPNLTGGYGIISIASLGGTVTPAVAALAGPITPVPEPETFAMLLAGLGVIGTFARRRNRTVTA